MKFLDKVKVVNLKKSYEKENIKLNEVGVIWEAEIRDNSFYVMFDNNSDEKFYNNFDEKFDNEKKDKSFFKYCIINIEDLELVEEGLADDNTILDALPQNNPNWWCKVEDGYILNLLGERKNKEPYKYNT